MKLSANASGFEPLFRRLRQLSRIVAEAASAAATNALAREVERSNDAGGISAPLLRAQIGTRDFVGMNEPEAVERELGTLTQDATPWLAPVLPAARGPMRAAAVSAAARALTLRKK